MLTFASAETTAPAKPSVTLILVPVTFTFASAFVKELYWLRFASYG